MISKNSRRKALLSVVWLILTVVVYYRITHNQLNLTTGILFLAASGAVMFGAAEIVMSVVNCSMPTRNNIRLLLITLSLLLIGLELFLRFGINRYSTYFERNGEKNYFSVYRHGTASWFHVYQKNQPLEYTLPEFTHARDVNSLGLCEQEIAPEKADNAYRIIALGDSYTEGRGTAYHSTWVKVVERNLADRFPNQEITTINAGISGSDPFFLYILLREKLLIFQPDLVIIAINNSDVNDVLIRGGMERFQADGSLTFQDAPAWEWAYAISYIFRHFIHDLFQYDWLLIKKSARKSEELKAVEKLKSAIDAFTTLSQEHHFKLLIVTHPTPWDVKFGKYTNNLDHLVSYLEQGHRFGFLELLAHYRVNDIITKEDVGDYYWKIDEHHNTKGYEAMGNAIAHKIVELQWIDAP
jgi:lysophospholipase L1-like esterase